MIQNRHNQILEWLQTEKSISAAALSERLHVSNMTIWRDLKQLEQQGLLKRVHGGCAAVPSETSSSSLHTAFQLNPAVFSPLKSKIGRYAAHFLIEENDNIALEGGTTVSSMVPYIDQAQYHHPHQRPQYCAAGCPLNWLHTRAVLWWCTQRLR